MLLSVGLVLAMNFWTGTRNTRDLVREKAGLIIDTLDMAVTDNLAPAQFDAEYLAKVLVERFDSNPPAIDYLEPLLVGALAATPQIDSVQFTTDTYEQFITVRDDTGHIRFEHHTEVDDLLRKAVDAARGQANPYWWQPVYVERVHDTFISFHAPVVVKGVYRGVVIAAVSMASVSKLTSDLSAKQGMTAFVLSGDRVLGHYMLAGSTRNVSQSNPTVTRDELGDDVLKGLGKATDIDIFRGKLPEGVSVKAVPQVRGMDWVVITKPMPQFGALDLTIGTYIDAPTLAVEFDRMLRSGLVGLGALLLSVLLAIWAGRRIAQPIQELATQAVKVGDLDFDQVPRIPGSSLKELDEQARSFNTMIEALRWFERYVPKKLVRRIVSSEETEFHSESRLATVCFTDIAGYTHMTEHLSPAATADLLNRHFGLLAECIEEHDGLVDKYMGDGMMAFWLAPEGDGAETVKRARSAALAMAAAIERDNRARVASGEPAIQVRIGLHSGPVIVGNIGSPGRINYTVVGATVNVAQRLEQFARGHATEGHDVTIVASGATARFLDPQTYEPLGKHRVRGLTGSLEVVRLKQKPRAA